MKNILLLSVFLMTSLSFANLPSFNIKSILNSGDGKSIETAYIVNSVFEEYLLLDYLKLKSVSQKLYIKDGFFIDAIQTKNKTIYFKNIEKKLLKKVNALKT